MLNRLLETCSKLLHFQSFLINGHNISRSAGFKLCIFALFPRLRSYGIFSGHSSCCFISLRWKIVSLYFETVLMFSLYCCPPGLLEKAERQWRSQNVENFTHIKGRLLDQAMVIFDYVPFQNGNFPCEFFLKEQFLLV